MKRSSEPPGGMISAAISAARPGPRIRVTVRDLDGTDRSEVAKVTVMRATSATEATSSDKARPPAVGPPPDGWSIRDEPRIWGGLEGVPGLRDPRPIVAGHEVVLASAAANEQYRLDVECHGNGVDSMLPSRHDRLLDVTITLDCTGGWSLPIFGRGDRQRDGIGWHAPE